MKRRKLKIVSLLSALTLLVGASAGVNAVYNLHIV